MIQFNQSFSLDINQSSRVTIGTTNTNIFNLTQFIILDNLDQTTLTSFYYVKQATLALFLIFLALLTVFGNVLVMLAIFIDFEHLRQPSHFLMGSLAMADLLLATDVLCSTASIYLVLLVSIDRYIAITRPLHYNMIVTKRRCYYMILLAWIFSLLVSLARLIKIKKFLPVIPPPTDYINGTNSTLMNANKKICEMNDGFVYALGSASLSYYIPLLIILAIYYKIFKEAKQAQNKFIQRMSKRIKDKKKILRTNRSEESNVNNAVNRSGDGSVYTSILGFSTKLSRFSNKLQKEQKAAKTLAIVVGCLILCWAPFFIILPIDAFCKSCQIPRILFTSFIWLGYCNSAMNPLIYALSSKEFRQAYKRILKCCYRNNGI